MTLLAFAPAAATAMDASDSDADTAAATATTSIVASLRASTSITGAPLKCVPSTTAVVVLVTLFVASDAAIAMLNDPPSDSATDTATAASVLSISALS